MNVDEYKRGPINKETFAVSINPQVKGGKIYYWPGNADIEVHPDKRYSQATLSVYEQERTISRRLSYDTNEEVSEEQLLRCLIMEFDVDTIETPKFSIKNIAQFPTTLQKWDVRNRTYVPSKGFRYSADLIAKVSSRPNHLLMGFDERFHFVAQLSRKPHSVVEAHHMLRPAPARKQGTVRQGEWFFVPVSSRIENKLNVMAQNPHNLAFNSTELGVQLEDDSSHFAKQAIYYKGNMYAIGYIYDTRTHHHEGVFLPRWSKVVRNKEVVAENTRINPQRKYWD